MEDIPTTCEWEWNGEPLINYPTHLVDSPEAFTLPYNYTPPHDSTDSSPIATPSIISPIATPSTISPIPQDATTWQTIVSPHPLHVLTSHHGNGPQSLIYSISTSDLATIAHSYLGAKSAWIIPKQNKITINCKLEAEIKDVLQVFTEMDGALIEVSKLLFSIDAIRAMDGQVTPNRAPLFIQNAQKAMIMPEPVQIFPKEYFDCTATWQKLQFSTTTSGNATKIGASERFHFVISLIAHVNQGPNTIALVVNSVRSPPVIVIGQNPARFTKSKTKQKQDPILVTTPPPQPPPQPPQSQQLPQPLQTLQHQSQQLLQPPTLSQFSEMTPNPHSKRKRIEEGGNTAESVFNIEGGKVGINCKPYETLAVGGNILYTGEIFKPSDRRIKRNFVSLNQGNNNLIHLHNISQIKLYQYERMDLSSKTPRFIPERGVIAQEVKQIIPSAVTTLGNTTLPSGEEIELQAVNHQELLIETIGATQDLNTKTTALSEEVQNLAETQKKQASLLGHLSDAVKYVQTNENAHIASRFSIQFQCLGPAWTACILGFFFPPMFIVGAFCIKRKQIIQLFDTSKDLCSKIWHRQLAGLASIALFTIFTIEVAVLAVNVAPVFPYVFIYMYTGYMFFGVSICAAVTVSICVKRFKGRSEAVVVV